MKNRSSILGISLAALIAIGVVAGWRHVQTQNLYTTLLQSASTLHHLKSDGMGLNFKGDALILYRAKHDFFPDFTAQRVLIRDNFKEFDLQLRGINGLVLSHLRRQPDFESQLWAYQPHKDLLDKLLLTLALMHYDNISFDISLHAHLTAPNQLFVQIDITTDGHQKMQLTTKMTPPLDHQTVWDNLTHAPLMMQLNYLDPEWKDLLDNYSQSKGVPFLTDKNLYPLTLSK